MAFWTGSNPVTSLQLAPEQGLQPEEEAVDVRRRCEEEAQKIVRQANVLPNGQHCVHSPRLTQLISNLTTLLLQIKARRKHSTLSRGGFVD